MVPPPSPPGDDSWALVGREDELRRARVALEGAGAVVCAGWGMGAAAFARAAVPRPWARLLATPSGADQPLYGVRTLLGDASPPGDAVVAAAALRKALAAAGGRPVLVVEGWDHLDGPSATVLARVVDEGALRIVAVREDDAPVSAATAAVWLGLGLERVDLLPLPDEAMAALLDRLLDGPVEGRTLVLLLRVASGSPSLLRQVVDASVAADALVERAGLWQLVGEPTLPPAVVDLARSLLDGLDPAARAAADLLAVAGPLPLAIAVQVTDPAGLERLERSGLAHAAPDDRGRLAIGLADAAVAAHLDRTLPATARLRLVIGLADATAHLPEADHPDLYVRSTEWALEAGRPGDAARLLAAARVAIDLGDPARAERLAAASAERNPTTEAVLLQSWCADEGGAVDRSERVLADHEPRGDEAVVALAIRRAEQQFWTHRDPGAASHLLHEAGARVAPPWDQAVVAQQAVFDLLDGRTPAALDAARPLLGHPTRMVGSTAGLAAALALVMDDRPDEAVRVAEDALAALTGPDPALYIDPGVHIISLGFGYEGQGRWNEAAELSEAVYRHALGRPGRQAQGWAALLRSRILTAQGRPLAARAVALEAEHIWREAGLVGLARWSAVAAAQAAATSGDVATLERCLERIELDDSVPFRLLDPEVERARTWAACLRSDRGRAATARARLGDLARTAGADGRRALAVLAAFDLVRLGDAALGASILDELVDERSPEASQLRAQVAAAVVEGAAERLEGLADAWEAAGATGTAAECLAFASAARPVRAAGLAPRIEALVADRGLATPPLAALAGLHGRQQLTAREQEIVAMVAEGLTNRAIAERLVVSTRTVENHLHRAYAKLGVASRSELVGPAEG